MNDLVGFYEGKTAAILRRYGPGPRVHYHTGIMEDGPKPGASIEELRLNLVNSQERLLWHASHLWGVKEAPFKDVLDVGCGLGGGSIFWAQEFGAFVTAVTIAPSHIELVGAFAAQAGVAAQVHPLLCDALLAPGESRFDAAVAIDSSSSFARRPWFWRLARVLRRHGRVLIFDCFLGRRNYEEPFNRHWCAQIGSLEEYVSGALEAGFTLEMIEDVSTQAIHFWDTSIALIRAEALGNTASAPERTKLSESLRIHTLVRQGVSDGGLSHRLMSFRRA